MLRPSKRPSQSYRLLFVVVTGLAAIVLGGCARDCTLISLPPDDVTKTFFASWHSHAKECRVGGYDIIGPPNEMVDKGNGAVTIMQHGRGQTMVQIASPNEIDIFSGSRPVVTVQHRGERDGYDFVSYSVRDKQGNYIGEITDGQMEGQAGFKLLDDGTAYAFIDGTWMRFERHGSQPGVLGASGWKSVQRQGLFRYSSVDK